MTNRSAFIRTFLTALLLATGHAMAAVIVSDTFTGATFDSDNGILSSAMDYGPLSNTTSTSLGVEASGGNPGEYLAYGHSTGTTSFFTANLPSSVSLAEIGDWVNISLDFRTVGGGTGNRVLRFGLFESGADINEATGFFVAGTTTGNNNSRLAADLSTTSNQFLVDQPSVSTSNTTGAQIVGGEWTAANLRIERTASDQYTLTSTYGALTFNPFVVNSSLEFDLDQVWIGINNRGTSFDIDNLTVTAIPEPGTLALVGIALGSLLLFRRRK
ncbi:MAG: PEP-CTERM sorting domain-containing protein [Verrucomicrobia bacterium]|nr:PEP-CTERM sorting domain-containing protein [Verrucomicrobiota bacterium]MCH8526020.1 PEP-CTERM sorting domain-containing protein [Kiritimatiellia bacterium]